jgi:flagellar hook protein FlgE
MDENLSSTLGDLDIPVTKVVPPKATTEVGMETNLSPNSEFIAAFDPADPQATSHFSSSVTVYDSLGVSHNVNVFFNQTASGNWDWSAVANGTEMSDLTTPGTVLNGNVIVASGTLEFSNAGVLVNETQDPTQNNFHFFNAEEQVINFNFGTSVAEGGTGLDGTRQFDSPATLSNITQDGYGAGVLAEIKMNLDGTINGTFTNTERRVLGAVAVARFMNNDGLTRRDGGHWVASTDSGQAIIGNAGTGGRGTIIGGNLEQSSVDIANEFVKIIAYQRAFQANSRTIRTADQMLMEAVSLKR